ncbi:MULTISPECIES: hypothetical protein [unclassified Snodgrassella]|uniref:hypothetical protein n=1 Tax=unclassified Snodgrassella TaxID=2625236 RepID=UPI0018DDC3F8|nr:MULTISPECIES: hypothetical protein [unclassified Snodgrassella]MBI0068778.1 hypothetical protein [Snodgrassella sp. M0110]MBI0077855.1 hypothetical protein [Snodgrassella sp. M0118]MBI0080155.1 hypothetical protein [Snodgrassella sp. M0112]
MKKILLIILIFMSNNVFSDSLIDKVNNGMSKEIKHNSTIIDKLSKILLKKNIDIFQEEWESELNKKCNWVRDNIDVYLCGQEDRLSYSLCLLSEQNSFINELILLIYHNKIPVNIKLQKYITKIPEQKQYNIYFNLLTEKYASKFCNTFYTSTDINDCINRFLLTQYQPEEYGFKLTVDKSYLYDSPNLKNKTKIYLIREDKIELLNYKNNFYEVEYTTKKNKIIKKWLHCSAIDACISD